MFDVLVVVDVGAELSPPSNVMRFPIGRKAFSGNMLKWLYLIWFYLL